MGAFFWGLVVGLAVAGLGSAALGILAYRRVVALERRTRQAERLAELGTLTGGLAHEIKNPLSTVQLNLQLLQEDIGQDNPAYRRVANRLNTVKNETGRLRDILDDFLRYAGRLEVERRAVEINALLEELVDFFTPQAQLGRVQLRLNKSPAPIIAQADPRLLKQALLNLMLNSVQALSTLPGGGEMILSARQIDGTCRIDVIDTGEGIEPAALEKIFHAYYSTKKGGTGLGLPMAKRILAEHGGNLTVASEPGRGTNFTLWLPINPPDGKP